MVEHDNQENPRKCPVCGSPMELRTILHVEIVVCPEHGVWLDKAELEKIRLMDRRRAHTITRSFEKVTRRHTKVQGGFMGFWSLFGD